MSIRIGDRSFAPPAWSVALTALALAAFLSLGYWQLGRAREKQALVDAFMDLSVRTVDADGLDFGGLARYQHVRLRGAYDPTRQILLDTSEMSIVERAPSWKTRLLGIISDPNPAYWGRP